MNNDVTAIELLVNKAEEYSKTSLELFKLRAINTAADITSSLVEKAVILFVVALFLIGANITVALWLGDILGKYYYGFLIITTIYGLIGLLLFYFRKKWIKQSISNIVINGLYKYITQ
jgi:uncharacterized membrane protein